MERSDVTSYSSETTTLPFDLREGGNPSNVSNAADLRLFVTRAVRASPEEKRETAHLPDF